jgi:ADP-heptose:LPS heptosyltransferase
VQRFSSRIPLLQWIDHRIGAPVCALLTVVHKGAKWVRRSPRLGPARSILFVKLAEQGSTVLACDAVRAAISRMGRENVYFIVFEENRFILDILELVPRENVFAVRTTSPAAMVASTLRHLGAIRRRAIDTCVDLEFFARSSAILAYLSGAHTRIGFHSYFGEGPYRGDLLTHRVIYNPHLHTRATFLALVEALDLDPQALPMDDRLPGPVQALPAFVATAAERSAVTDALKAVGVPARKRLILLNANCGDLLPLRKWSDDNYVLLAQRLLRELGEVVVVFTGSGDEAEHVQSLVARVGSPACVSLAGSTSLRELLALYGVAEVLVTNDSGPAHFAALTTIDVVALFGPETPLLFAVPGPRSHALWARLPCSPCVNAYNNRQTACRDNRCMQALSVDLVFETTMRVFRARHSVSAESIR